MEAVRRGLLQPSCAVRSEVAVRLVLGLVTCIGVFLHLEWIIYLGMVLQEIWKILVQ